MSNNTTINHTNPCTLCPIGISDPTLCKGCAYNKGKEEKGPKVTITIIEVRL